MNELREMAEKDPFVLQCLKDIMMESVTDVEEVLSAGYTLDGSEKSNSWGGRCVCPMTTPGLPLFGLEVLEETSKRIKDYEGQEVFMIVKFKDSVYELTRDYDSWAGYDSLFASNIRKGRMERKTTEVFVQDE